ncbi:MAG TPA: hypothetical protein VK187_03750, partial [Geobacteraceae bacterium]|nr:hypothetical protein [Geobacteraceae bacterium]
PPGFTGMMMETFAASGIRFLETKNRAYARLLFITRTALCSLVLRDFTEFVRTSKNITATNDTNIHE